MLYDRHSSFIENGLQLGAKGTGYNMTDVPGKGDCYLSVLKSGKFKQYTDHIAMRRGISQFILDELEKDLINGKIIRRFYEKSMD